MCFKRDRADRRGEEKNWNGVGRASQCRVWPGGAGNASGGVWSFINCAPRSGEGTGEPHPPPNKIPFELNFDEFSAPAKRGGVQAVDFSDVPFHNSTASPRSCWVELTARHAGRAGGHV